MAAELKLHMTHREEVRLPPAVCDGENVADLRSGVLRPKDHFTAQRLPRSVDLALAVKELRIFGHRRECSAVQVLVPAVMPNLCRTTAAAGLTM